jgi:outer membrane protein assembly factor BamB
MKKLLSILGIMTMITGSSTMAVACGCVPTKNEPEYSSFYSMQISNTTLKNVLIKSNEVIYATSENHVYQINPKNHTFIKLGKTPLPDYEITGLLIGKNEELYIIAGIINKSEHQVAGNIYKYNSMTDMFEEILTGNIIDGGYIYSSVFNNNKDMMYISINPTVKK